MPDLSTRTARRGLPRSKRKHWTRLARGHGLGYQRTGDGPGVWYVRSYIGGQTYRSKVLGTADDLAASNGSEVLTYGQAAERALAWNPDSEDERHEPVTVRGAVERYLTWFRSHRRSYDRVRYLFEAQILPALGDERVDRLTVNRLRRWHQAIAEAPARLRGGQARPAVSEDQQRARKVSANRALAALKAALNRAFEDGLIEESGAWRKVKPFRGVEAARVQYLERDQVTRLVNSCPADLRDLVLAGIHTGARYGEIAALRVRDYRAEAGAVHFPKTKSDAPRHVYLSDEGVAFLDRLTAGRRAEARLLVRADGKPWGRNHQYRPMRQACAAAGIDPPLGFHQLRHTYASLYLMSGGSLISLAKQLGHSTTRMVEKHYGHLADAWRADEARQHAPTLGTERGRVARLRRA